MQEIILFQIAYAIAGFLFNAVSWLRVRYGMNSLTPTQPALGMAMMILVFLVAISSSIASGWIYRIGWVALLTLILPGGIMSHLKSISKSKALEGYLSRKIAYLAVGINIFGVVVGTLGIALSFFP